MSDNIELNKELDILNKAVETAVAVRTKWMDEHMTNYASIPIGEEIYTVDGDCVGIVTGHYRYWGDGRDWRFDTSMGINYYYKTKSGYIDNTSRQSSVFVDKETARNIVKSKLNSIK